MANSRAFGFDARRLISVSSQACPHDLASVEKCNRQIGLRIEVAVEAGLGTARLCQDGIDADLINAVRTEQIVSRVEDALARSGRGSDYLCSQSAFPRDSPWGRTGALVVFSRIIERARKANRCACERATNHERFARRRLALWDAFQWRAAHDFRLTAASLANPDRQTGLSISPHHTELSLVPSEPAPAQSI